MSPQAVSVFSSRPDHLVPDFKQHLAASAEPHTWRYHSHSAPPRDGVEVLLANFLIPARRKGRAPCPICSPDHPKYLKGHLVWSSSTGTLHAVGHCCGHTYFNNDGLRTGLKAASERLRRREDEAFLWGNWESPRRLLELADLLAPLARSYDQVAKAVRAGVSSPVCRAIHRMASPVGFLEVVEEVRDVSGSGLRAVTKRFGSRPFHGVPFLKGGRVKSAEGSIRAAVVLFDHLGWETEDDAVLWLASRPDPDLRLLSGRLKDAALVMEETKSSLTALQAFLEPGNLDLLTRWSAEAHGPNAVRLFHHVDGTLAIWRGAEKVRQPIIPRNLSISLPDLGDFLPPREDPLL